MTTYEHIWDETKVMVVNMSSDSPVFVYIYKRIVILQS